MEKKDIRIALVIHMKDTDEDVLTRFCKPDALSAELQQLRPCYKIAETYLADKYGNRV